MSDSLTIDQMIVDLKNAGWTAKTSTIWRSPHGTLHVGPAGAWRRMRDLGRAPINRADKAEATHVALIRQLQQLKPLNLAAESDSWDAAYADGWNDCLREIAAVLPPEDPAP